MARRRPLVKKKINRLNSLYGFASNVPFVLLLTFQPHLPEPVDGLFLIAVAIQDLLVKPLRFPDRGHTLPSACRECPPWLVPCKFSNIQTFKSLYTQTFGF